MAVSFSVVLQKNENLGYGFSLLGKEGFPHIIYDVVKNSPASENQIEAGDVIVKINGTEVHRLTTKEVLKRLRLSNEAVELELRRDTKIKSHVNKYLAAPNSPSSSPSRIAIAYNNKDMNTNKVRNTMSEPLCRPSRIPTPIGSKPTNNSWSSLPQSPQLQQPKARFEAYMMTGDLILNISKAPRVKGPKSPSETTDQQKPPKLNNKINRNGAIAPHAKYDSSTSTSSEEQLSAKSSKSVVKQTSQEKREQLQQEQELLLQDQLENDPSPLLTSSPSSSSPSVNNSSSYSNDECPLLRSNDRPDGTIKGGVVTSSNGGGGGGGGVNRVQKKSINTTISVSSAEISYSVPTSPISITTANTSELKTKETNSAPTSPDSVAQDFVRRNVACNLQTQGSLKRKTDVVAFRTSRSEDPLQQAQRDGHTIVPIDIDDDFNSSLNTLLDTRDSDGSQSADHERIVWTYNAPIATNNYSNNINHHNNSSSNNAAAKVITSPQSNGGSSSHSMSSSPQLVSPTSVSSSVMSSGSKNEGTSNDIQNLTCPLTNDQSVSEAVSNISSPDYQDEDNLLMSSRDLGAMNISDPSDSDSTILASDKRYSDVIEPNKIVIQVAGNETSITPTSSQPNASDDVRETMQYQHSHHYQQAVGETSPPAATGSNDSPPMSDDSDIDSLHSFHISPKRVDLPSAIRLAKRLYHLDGFRKSDVSKHLSKNNEFSRAVAEEYLKYFDFEGKTLDEALREFLKKFALSGETQERERVLVHFSKRYLDCNPGSFNSQDAVHTLTCAIMLLNTDLHGQNIGRKMTCSEFIDNLSELNDGENFPKDILKHIYHSIKSHALEWAVDDDLNDPTHSGRGDTNKQYQQQPQPHSIQASAGGGFTNPFLDVPDDVAAIEYKKGYVMRKCCYDINNKKTPFGKRSWKMFYCTLRDLVMYLHKDEHGFRKNQVSDNFHNAIRLHHALATKASDYVKKQHVFRLQTAEQAEYLFQTSDSKELQSWIDTINYVCAAFSAPALPGAVSSSKRFQRPLLPCTHTKLTLREQLRSHEEQMISLEQNLDEHKQSTVPSKGLALQNYKEKEAYLSYEFARYRAYVNALRNKIAECENQQYESDGMSHAGVRRYTNEAAYNELAPKSSMRSNHVKPGDVNKLGTILAADG